MKNLTHNGKSGFTLIELIVVIAILAIVAMIGIRSYANLRETQAKKMNLANIKRIEHALNTYATIHHENGSSDYFKNFDALVDVAKSGAWFGTAGDFDWGTGCADARQVNGGLGIYDGSWKVLSATYNANGQGSGSVPELNEAMDKNRGMRDTGLYKILGIYYLTEADATLLKNAGVTQICYHNPSTAQATGSSRGGYCSAYTDATKEGLVSPGGGGPGFRPNMSAFYPVELKEGLPVAVINPSSTIYSDFGYQITVTNKTDASELNAKISGQNTKLIAFGIGQNAECVKNIVGLGEAPENPSFDKKNYRQYIAVFAITTRGQGISSTCHLAGVIDCAGQTFRAAQYAVDWSTSLN